MLSGFSTWSNFEAFGLSQNEYENLEEKLAYLEGHVNAYLERVKKCGAKIFDSLELDISTYYSYPNVGRMTAWFIHDAGIRALVNASPSWVKPIVFRCLTPFEFKAQASFEEKVLESLGAMSSMLNMLKTCDVEEDCLYALAAIDFFALDILRSINAFYLTKI